MKYKVDIEQLSAAMAVRRDYRELSTDLANGTISLQDTVFDLTQKSHFHKTGGAGGPVPGPITIGLLAVIGWKAVVAGTVVVAFVYSISELYELMSEGEVTCDKGRYYIRNKVRNAAYLAVGELVLISPDIVTKVFVGQKQFDCSPEKVQFFKSNSGEN